MAFLEPLRFLKHRRERLAEQARLAAEERAAERAHQLAIAEAVIRGLETVSESSARQNAETAAALIEIAKSNQAQAEGFTTWLKSFQIAEPPTSSVVREEDEFSAEQARLAEQLGLPAAAGEHLPEEFRIAFELAKGISDIGKTPPI